MHLFPRRSAIAVCGVLAAAPLATAAVTYTAQSRVIVATPFSGSPITHSAPDFGTWTDAVSAINDVLSAGGAASQTSTLAPGGVSAVGHATAYDGLQTSTGNGRTSLDITFSVDQATPYHLVGSWQLGWEGFTVPFGYVRFGTVGAPSGLLDSFSTDPMQPNPRLGDTFDISGVLAPVSYRLQAWILQTDSTPVGTGQRDGSFSVQLDVPGPAAAPVLLVPLLGRRPRGSGG